MRKVLLAAAALAAVAAAGGAIALLPDIKRYLRIRSM
ncbi:DUF6893 family small protein [Streptomyces sp. NBC_01525]